MDESNQILDDGLEDKIKLLGSKPEDKSMFSGLGQAADMYKKTFMEPGSRAIKQFNIGLSHILGLPSMIDTAIKQPLTGRESVLPSSTKIQKGMADLGMTYQPGTEPDDFSDRIYQNIGSSAIPIAGLAAKGKAVAGIGTEMLSNIGAAGGGKIAESTEWGKENPTAARVVGELAGGLALPSSSVLKHAPLPITGAYKAVSAPFKGQWARGRAVKQLRNMTLDPDKALREYDNLKNLSPSQKTGEKGIAGLRKRIEEDSLAEQSLGMEQRSGVLTKATKEIKGAEQVEAVRFFLDKQLKEIANLTNERLSKIKTTSNPETYSRIASESVKRAYREARTSEVAVWNNLKPGDMADANKTLNAYKEEISSITRGGDFGEVDGFLKKKLGTINKNGEIVGGDFLTSKKRSANAKELHQFYSRVNQRIMELSETAGNTNKIRILNNIKKAAMDDIETMAVGDDYKAAIAFSRDLNEKFTRGSLGTALGFRRGLATPETMFLDEIIGSGGEKARLGVEQLFKADPSSKDAVESFIKSNFALSAVDNKTGIINSTKGKTFLNNNRNLLDGFPDLKKDIEDAVMSQRKADDFLGVTDISLESPLIREKSAASLMLNAEPGEEISKLLQYGKSRGKTTEYLTSLVKEVRKDKTGSALNGLKNAFAEEIMNNSMLKSSLDEISGETFISGSKFLKNLNRLTEPALKSGLMTQKDISKYRKIGESLKRVELELSAKAPEKIMTDAPGRVMDLFSAIVGAQVGGKLSVYSPAGSLQTASLGSGFSKQTLKSITKDEAKLLLIQATKDDDLMKQLLKEVKQLTLDEQGTLMEKIVTTINKLKPKGVGVSTQKQTPVSAIAVPAASMTREDQTLEDKIKNL